MQSEPTLITEAVRAALILLAAFGFSFTDEQQRAIILLAGVLVALGSAALAWYNRSKVYAPATVERIASTAAATGQVDIGSPPHGD